MDRNLLFNSSKSKNLTTAISKSVQRIQKKVADEFKAGKAFLLEVRGRDYQLQEPN
jgi:hypothetical protein